MRLKPRDIDALKTAARETFGEDACVRLYGSRVDDSLRGGDIDIIIETAPVENDWQAKGRFLDRLFTMIDEQRVDIVLAERGKPLPAFVRMVLPDSVPLP